MKLRRTPFYGDPEDAALLPGPDSPELPSDIPLPTLELLVPAADRVMHEDYREKGTSVALGLIPHQGENRRQRRAAVATWVPPKDQPKAETAGEGSGDQDVGPEPSPVPTPRMPTRRELWLQRKKHRRGKLDPELRRLQKAKLNGPRSD